jgi:hypothetical protein
LYRSVSTQSLYTRAAAWRQRHAQSPRWAMRRHDGMGRRCFLFDTTAPQMLYTHLCSLCILQRQRREPERKGAR